jgi:hypothetical protein
MSSPRVRLAYLHQDEADLLAELAARARTTHRLLGVVDQDLTLTVLWVGLAVIVAVPLAASLAATAWPSGPRRSVRSWRHAPSSSNLDIRKAVVDQEHRRRTHHGSAYTAGE